MVALFWKLVEANLREERGVRDRRAAMDAGTRMAIIGVRRARFDAMMARERRIWLRDSVHCYRRTSFSVGSSGELVLEIVIRLTSSGSREYPHYNTKQGQREGKETRRSGD